MKCPYCGAELQENARFCLYCMKSLQEKTPITAPQARRWRGKRLLVPLAALLAVLAIAALVIGLRHGSAQEEIADLPTDSTAEAAQPTATPTESTAEQHFVPINSYNDFYFDAISETERLAAQDLWEPVSLYLLDRTETMEIYSAPLFLQDAAFHIYYMDGGVEILAAVTNLTEEQLPDGLRLADCISAATYYAVSDNVPSLASAAPSEPVEAGDSYAERLRIDDPAAQQSDGEGAISVKRCRLEPQPEGDAPKQYLIYELRTRRFDGTTYYDIFLYYGQE